VVTIVLRKCKNCGKTFQPDPRNVKKGRGIFCSRECFNEYYNKKPKKFAVCQYCGKGFITYSCRRGKFCSEECYQKYWIENILPKIISKRNGSIELTCQNCGKPFKALKSRLKRFNVRFCSKKCFDEYKRIHSKEFNAGNKHWNWKGGISVENHRLRRRKEYQRWREAILKRDNYTCRLCGYKGEKLIAHHIYSFSQYPELRYDVSNGITLCPTDHAKIHVYKDEEALKLLATLSIMSR